MRRPSRVFLSVAAAAALVVAFLAPAVSAAEPTIVRSPAEGVPGSVVRVSGDGFLPDEAVDVYLDASDLALGVAGPRGAFPPVSLTVPAGARVGTHWITAEGRLSHRAVHVPFDVVPGSWVSWSQAGADAGHTGLQPSERTLDRAAVAELGRVWATGQPAGESAVVLGRVLVTSAWTSESTAGIRASDAWTGAELWSASGFEGVQLAGWNGLLIAQTGRQLRAYDPSTGTLRWTRLVGPYRTGSWEGLTIAGDVAYVIGNDLRWNAPAVVSAFDLRRQRALWTSEPLLGPKASYAQRLVVTGGTVVVAIDQGLVGVAASDGAVRWEKPWILGWSEGLVARDGTVFTSSMTRESVLAVAATTGAVRWRAPFATGLFGGPPAVDGSRVYLTMGPFEDPIGARGVRAYDASTGALVWERRTTSRMGPPAVANGLVYALGGHELIVLDDATGDVVARSEVPAEVWVQPLVANATLYLPTYDRGVIAMRAPGAPRPTAASLTPDPALVPGPTQPVTPMTQGWSEGPAVAASLGGSVASAAELDGTLYLGTTAGATGTASVVYSTDGAVFSPAARFPGATTVRLAAFGGRLYAAATGPEGASLYVSSDGIGYELVRSFAATSVLRMTPIAWGDRLVVAADTAQGPALWTSTDGETFARAARSTAAARTRFAIDPMGGGTVIFDGALYLGAGAPGGGELWRTVDGTTLDRVASAGLGRRANEVLAPQLVFGARMYVVASGSEGLEIFRSADGSRFTRTAAAGFGSGPGRNVTGRLAAGDGRLVLVSSNRDPRPPVGDVPIEVARSHGLQVRTSADGAAWTRVGTRTFTDPHDWAGSLAAESGVLYLASTNHRDGDAVWRSDDGISWTQLFREPGATAANAGPRLVVFDRHLLLLHGDAAQGLSLWRLDAPVAPAPVATGTPWWEWALLAALLVAVAVLAVVSYRSSGRRAGLRGGGHVPRHAHA